MREEILNNLVRECYLVSKHTHTSYTDMDNITYVERQLILKYIMNDLENQNKLFNKVKNSKKGT